MTAPVPTEFASTVRHRVPFYETDGMGIVHHANYVRYFELARIVWMDEHDRPYREYVEEGLHFATIRAEVRYRRPAAFDDVLAITTWLEWVKGASLRMAYEIRRGDETLASGATEHALVDQEGRPRRLPPERRARLARAARKPPQAARSATAGRSEAQPSEASPGGQASEVHKA